MKKKDNDMSAMAMLKKFDQAITEMAQSQVGKLILGDPNRQMTEAAVPHPNRHANTVKKTLKALDRVDELERQAFRKSQSALERAMSDLDELAKQVKKKQGTK